MERAIGQSLRALSQLSRAPFMAKLGLDGAVEKWLYQGTRAGLKAATQAAARMKPVLTLLQPARMPAAERPEGFDLTLTETQALMRETMARFARDVMREVALEADERGAPPAGFLDAVHELGLTQLAVPEALGGAGDARSVTTNVIVAEELSRGDMGLALAALAPLGVVHALVDFGTARQQGEFLPQFLGERFVPAAFALCEERPLFDPHRLTTRARREGDDYVLDGEKVLVPLGEDAELLLVAADLDGKPEAFLVERHAAGFYAQTERAMGLSAAKLARIRLENVRVPAFHRLGEGDIEFTRLVDLARIAWGALCVGTSSAMLSYVADYAKERIAFGEPIAHRQSVAFMIADMALERDAMQLMIYRAASRAEFGESFRREATLARLQCADKGMQIGTNGVQLLGGHGFIKEHPVELWYRQLRALGVVEGALLV